MTSAVSKVLLTSGMIGASTVGGAVSWPVLIALVSAWAIKEVADSATQDKIRASLEASAESDRTVEEAVEQLREIQGVDSMRIESLIDFIGVMRQGQVRAEMYLKGNQKLLIDLTRAVEDRFEELKPHVPGLTAEDWNELIAELRGIGVKIDAVHDIVTHQPTSAEIAAMEARLTERINALGAPPDEREAESIENAIDRIASDAQRGDPLAQDALENASPEKAVDYFVNRSKKIDEARDKATEALDHEQIENDRELIPLAFRVGRIRDAEDACRRILNHLPNDLEATNYTGHIHRLQGYLDDANKAYARVLELGADDPVWRAAALGSMGIVTLTRGDLDEATRLYGEALELNKQLGSLEGQA
ncbi:MAG: hypothetical protein RLN60_00780, partial [Phycisphaerales bacterium]